MTEPEDLTRLMQQEIDRANTPAETAELRARLQADADARAEFEELKMVAQGLEDAAVPPPPGLRRAVLDAIAVAPAAGRPSFTAWLGAIWPNRVMALRYAGVLLAGIAMGLAGGLWIGLPRFAPVPSSVAGTMAPSGQDSRDEWRVEFQGLRGVVRWNQAPPVIALHCDLEGQGASDMVVAYDTTQARFEGLESGAPEDLSLRLDEGRVSLHGSFRSPFTLRFARTGAGELGATVQLLRGGTLLGTKTVTFATRQ
jgi:hypothetical protein